MQEGTPERTCKTCGDKLPPGAFRHRIYCSRKCSELDGPPCGEDGCDAPAVARGLCRPDWKRRYGTPVRYPITCIVCGKTHLSARKNGKYCSEACRRPPRPAKPPRRPAPTLAIPPRVKRTARVIMPDPEWRGMRTSVEPTSDAPFLLSIASMCDDCGAKVWARRGVIAAGGAVRCPACRRLHIAQGKGYGGRGSTYSRLEIFERDKWRCHLCGRTLSPQTSYPDPRMPSIDHLVPLALGGEDTAANVRCACLECNIRKGCGGGGEQLMLFG